MLAMCKTGGLDCPEGSSVDTSVVKSVVIDPGVSEYLNAVSMDSIHVRWRILRM